MPKFVQYKEYLLDRYEWAQGSLPSGKDNAARWREVNKGFAEIVKEF